jgi:acyl carrier protein
MDRGYLLNALDELLELGPGTLKGSEDLAELGWDSVRAIEFIVLAEEKAGAQIVPAKLAEAKTINDLLLLLGATPEQS